MISPKRITNELNKISYNYSYKHNRNFIKEKVMIYDLIDRFWVYAKVSLKNLEIFRIEDLYLYLKEFEFRFNNKKTSTYEIIIYEIAQNDWVTNYLMG